MFNGWSRYLGFATTLGFVLLLAFRVDLHEVAVALTSANYVWVVPAFGCTVASYILRTWRWKRILRPIQPVPYRALLPVLFIGFMANNLLPARMGEVVRAYFLGRTTGLSKSLGLATILLERLCDGVTLVAVLGLVALLFPLPAVERQVGYVAGAIFLIAAGGTGVVLANERLAFRLLAAALRPLPRPLGERLQRKAESFVAGLRVLRHGRDLLVVAIWSALIWSIETSTYFVVLQSVHLPLAHGTPLLAALLLMVMVNLGTLIPSAPGYVGAFQAFGLLALSAFGAPESLALAVTIVAHAVQWITVTGLGLLFAGRESVGLSGLAVPAAPPAGSELEGAL